MASLKRNCSHILHVVDTIVKAFCTKKQEMSVEAIDDTILVIFFHLNKLYFIRLLYHHKNPLLLTMIAL